MFVPVRYDEALSLSQALPNGMVPLFDGLPRSAVDVSSGFLMLLLALMHFCPNYQSPKQTRDEDQEDLCRSMQDKLSKRKEVLARTKNRRKLECDRRFRRTFRAS